MVTSATVVSAGCDYITATTHDKDGFNHFTKLATWLLRDEERQGCDVSPFFCGGFSGWSCGSIQAAVYQDWFMVRLSGAHAWRYWRDVAEAATNVSRFDVQSTIRLPHNDPSLAERFEALALDHEKKVRRRREIELRRNSARGNTLYIGRRVSDRFTRIYDKKAESKLDHYDACWRAECELKRKLAKSASTQMLRSQDEYLTANGMVQSWLAELGLPWPTLSARTQAVLAGMPEIRRFPNRRVEWLRSHVRKTVGALVNEGKLEEVLKALDLDQLVQVKGE